MGFDMTALTQDELKSLLRYDPDTGLFTWARSSRRVKEGAAAGSRDVHGYGQINLGGNRVMKLHRLAWLYVYGEWPSGQIDHINHDRLDNRIENLRVVSNTENHRNRPIQRNSTTGVVGVYYDRGRYVAKINVAGVQIHLGRHLSLEHAAAARAEANRQYGFHENHGVGPSCPQRPERRQRVRALKASA